MRAFEASGADLPWQGWSVVVVDRRASIQNRRFLDLSARFPMAWSTAGPLFLGEPVSMRVEPLTQTHESKTRASHVVVIHGSEFLRSGSALKLLELAGNLGQAEADLPEGDASIENDQQQRGERSAGQDQNGSRDEEHPADDHVGHIKTNAECAVGLGGRGRLRWCAGHADGQTTIRAVIGHDLLFLWPEIDRMEDEDGCRTHYSQRPKADC